MNTRKSLSLSAVLAAVLAIVLIGGCASITPAPIPLSPLQKAELAYTDFADGYALAMTTAVKLHDNGQINAAQWGVLYSVQQQVRAQQPIVRALLDQWAATQVKPANVDAQLSSLTGNLAIVKGVNATAGGK